LRAQQGQPFTVAAVDGTGSGDAYAAGLLYGVLAGWPIAGSARFANALGALAATRLGATEGIPDLDEALAFAGLG
jgi:sugar/nucleoside kinase (ribokinase family)